jgi:hypothetical protein
MLALLDIYPEKRRLGVHKNVDIDAHVRLTHNRQELETPRCPSVGEWLNKLDHSEKVFIRAATWVNL